MIFCPDVSVITVSGVISMCSIRSEFSTKGMWLRRVSWIMVRSRHFSIGGRPAKVYAGRGDRSPLAGVRFSRFDNPDLMIGEEIVGSRYFIAGHVAGNATGGCPGTRFCASVAVATGGCSTGGLPRGDARVTRKAPGVVSRRLVLHFAVW